VSSSGAATPIGTSPALDAGTRLTHSSRRTAEVGPGGATGGLDPVAVAPLPDGQQVLRLDMPEGATESFDWLELSVAGEPTPDSFSLTDVLGGNAAQSIQFQTIDRGVDRYLLQGASCPQWHDFTGGTLYLRHSSGAPVTITLQRSLSPPGQQSG
jgi:hypothetical protein